MIILANKNSNFPSNQLNNLPEGVAATIVASLRELSDKGRPQTEQELKSRIDEYFTFCGENDFRPGIESLVLSLSTTRQTFWNWCNGDKGQEWQDICIQAKQFCLTFLEQLNLQGKLNPASAIFYLKNWASYKDTVSFDDAPQTSVKQALSVSDLPQLDLSAHDEET